MGWPWEGKGWVVSDGAAHKAAPAPILRHSYSYDVPQPTPAARVNTSTMGIHELNLEHLPLKEAQTSLGRIHTLSASTPDLAAIPAFTAVADAIPLTVPFLGPLTTCPLRPADEARAMADFTEFGRNAGALQHIFETVSAHKQAGAMLKTYHQTVRDMGKEHAVEALMTRCLNSLHQLARMCLDAPRGELGALDGAIERLAQLKPSVPESVFGADTSTSSYNYNTGSGTQFIMSGRGHQYVNSGGGPQYNGLVNQYAKT